MSEKIKLNWITNLGDMYKQLEILFGGPNTSCARVLCDEDMTPSDMTIDYKVSSFLHLYSDFWYNSLGSTFICHYLLIGTNMSQSTSPSKLNF